MAPAPASKSSDLRRQQRAAWVESFTLDFPAELPISEHAEEIESGAVLVRSVVCPGAVVPAGKHIVDQVVPGSGLTGG